ncbi:MAG: S9 family peptidase [Acidobacteria bacterium]|nr:S9 family peptidase [Acidobacteriota bacterium]
MKKSLKFLLSPLVVISILAGLSISTRAQKRMTIEDSLAVKQAGAPEISPDARRVAYTISEWDQKENRRVSHIWISPLDGRRAIKLTNGEKGESAPQWSANGDRIAFLADRGGSNQIWIIPSDGGEAEKLTSEDNSVQSFTWSHYTNTIAFITRDVPKDKAEREKRKKDKFDTILVDSDYSYAHLWTINVETKEKKRLTEGAYSVSSPQFSPEDGSIAYVVSRTGTQESTYTDISEDRNTDIYVVPAQGGTPKQLTNSPGVETNPQWSPYGNLIAYTGSSDPKSWAAKNDLMIMRPDGGSPKNLTRNFIASTGQIVQWSRDGNSIYFNSGVGVYTHIYQATVSDGKIAQITKGNRNCAAFDITGSIIAILMGDNLSSDDIWIAPLDRTDNPGKITQINPQLKDFSLAETSVIKWKGPDNLDIEGILVKPLGYEPGKRYPLILQIHGGPYGRFSDTFNSRAQFFAANGYALLMPNPRGSTGYGHEFTVANVGDWGGKDFKDIMAGVDAVIANGVADPDRLLVMGGSYGGFMTFWTVTQTDRFKAAIGHAAISDWYSFFGQSDIPGLMEYGFTGMPWNATEVFRKWSPITFVEKVKTPLMITHGERDQRVPIAQGEQYYRSLKKRGVEVIFLRYPREAMEFRNPITSST